MPNSEGAPTFPRSRAAHLEAGESTEAFLQREKLLSVDAAGVARLPLLFQGELLLPELPPIELIERADTQDGSEFDLGETHFIPVVARAASPVLRYLALPRVSDASALIPRQTMTQTDEVISLTFADVAQHIDAIGMAMAMDGAIVRGALPLAIASTNQPEHFVRLGFSDVQAAFSGAAVGKAVDRELSYDGRAGREYLDGWVQIDEQLEPGAMAAARARLGVCESTAPAKRQVRAFPTRQLHITAGNSPVVPAISALRALSTKGLMTIKLPSGALVAGSAMALALWVTNPDHPLICHASIAYWRGGDEAVEGSLFRHGAFDRIVVWGSRSSVEAVTARAGGTKTLVFNPRYGISLLGVEALAPAAIHDTVRRAAQDTMIWNQQACIASLVHYVEGSSDDIDRYCNLLTQELAVWDEDHAYKPDRAAIGRIRAARRGELSEARWMLNGPAVAPTSGVVRMDHGFDLAVHPQARIVIVRRVANIADTLELMSSSVSSVGVWPNMRLETLRNALCASGVTTVLPLGEADTLFAGAPHDGIRALSELVSWSVA